MNQVAIVRAAYLNVYLAVLREMGAPIAQALTRTNLPSAIEEMPDAYVSLARAMDCVVTASRDVPLIELGFLATRGSTFEPVRPAFRRALLRVPPGQARLDTFMRLATSEDSAVAIWTRAEGGNIRWFCDLSGFGDHPALCLGEWLNLNAMIWVMRTVAGPHWRPIEITFVSSGPPSEAMQEAFADTRLRFGQCHSSILIERKAVTELSRERLERDDAAPRAAGGADGWTLAATVRELIRPYLDDGYPDIGFAATLVGMSQRTLQRRLKACGRTYSDVVQEARFDLARELLTSSQARIIDVALTAGYQNPQHFSRAFRKLAGVSPRTYRRNATMLR